MLKKRKAHPQEPPTKQQQEEEAEDEQKVTDVQSTNILEQLKAQQSRIESLRQKIFTNKTKTRTFEQMYFDHLMKEIDIFAQCQEMFQEARWSEIWPTATPPGVKINFLRTIGILSPQSAPHIIARFITTLESLNSNDDGCYLYNIQHLMATLTPHVNATHKILLTNLAFCNLIEPSFLVGTSFHDMTPVLYSKRIDRLIVIQAHNFSLYQKLCALNEARSLGVLDNVPQLYDTPPYTTEDNSDLPDPVPDQHLLEFLLQCGGSQGLRKNDKGVFEEVIALPEHVHTKFFRSKDIFIDWAWKCVTPKDQNRLAHHYLTLKASTESHITNLLMRECDPRIPRVDQKRTLYSYRNGIWCADTGIFYVYNNNGALPSYIRSVDELPADACTANYFDYVVDLRFFAPDFDLDDIPIPKHDKMLADQKFEKEDREAWECCFGRTLHPSSYKEQWQFAVWVAGCANSGKSTYLENWAGAFPKDKCGYLNDDTEDFVDQHLEDSWVVFGPDVSNELDVSATRFNSWVSGVDSVVIKKKHQMAVTKKWDKPIVFTSNTWPGIGSKAGSGTRRFVFFVFNFAITKADSRLRFYLEQELPLAVIRFGLRYLQWVKKYGNIGIWEDKPAPESGHILPKMCYDGRKEYTKLVSPPDAFLDSSACEYDPSYTCSVSDFRKHYAFFRATQLKAGPTQGHQRGRAYNPEVSAITFNYALQQRGCVWDVKTNIISGLRCLGSIDTQRAATRVVNSSSHPTSAPFFAPNSSNTNSSNTNSNNPHPTPPTPFVPPAPLTSFAPPTPFAAPTPFIPSSTPFITPPSPLAPLAPNSLSSAATVPFLSSEPKQPTPSTVTFRFAPKPVAPP